MGLKMIRMPDEEFMNLKTSALENKEVSRIKNIKPTDLQIIDWNNVSISGRNLPFSNEARVGLFKSLGLSKNMTSYFNKLAQRNKAEDSKKLSALLFKELNKGNKNMLNFSFHNSTNTITNVYSNKLISDSTYFEVIEKFIAKTPSSYLKSAYQEKNGNLVSVVNIPSLEFNFGNLSDEVFQTGLRFTLKPSGLYVDLHTTRLSCANGMTTTQKICSSEVKMEKDVPNFLSEILGKELHVHNIRSFKMKLNRTYNTPASLEEVLYCDNRLKSILGNDLYTPLSRGMSSKRLVNAFGDDIINFHKDDHKFLKTDISLWDLTNEVTAISSRIEREIDPSTFAGLNTYKNNQIQMLGGKMMFKDPDLIPSNIKQIF
jgi:hypothetical protein